MAWVSSARAAALRDLEAQRDDDELSASVPAPPQSVPPQSLPPLDAETSQPLRSPEADEAAPAPGPTDPSKDDQSQVEVAQGVLGPDAA